MEVAIFSGEIGPFTNAFFICLYLLLLNRSDGTLMIIILLCEQLFTMVVSCAFYLFFISPVVHLEEFSIKIVSVRVFFQKKYREHTFLLKICVLDTNFIHSNYEINSN